MAATYLRMTEGDHMTRAWAIIILCLPLVLASTATARDGLGVQYSLPSGTFGDAYEKGYGVVGFFDIPVGSFSTTGQVGVTRFRPNPDTELGQTTEEIHVWEFMAGANLNLSALHVGIERGYFTSVKEWDWVANVGVRMWKLDGSARWKTFSDPSWLSFRLGYLF